MSLFLLIFLTAIPTISISFKIGCKSFVDFRILKIPFPTVPKPMIPILHFCICYL